MTSTVEIEDGVLRWLSDEPVENLVPRINRELYLNDYLFYFTLSQFTSLVQEEDYEGGSIILSELDDDQVSRYG